MKNYSAGDASGPSALIITPTGLNYFYNLHGARIAEALREIGFRVEITTLARVPDRTYDWCVLTNCHEIVVSYGQEGVETASIALTPEVERAAIEAIRRLHDRARVVSACSLEPAQTQWYAALQQRTLAGGITTILDFGLYDQTEDVPAHLRQHYRYVVNGLTASERCALDSLPDTAGDRPLPWAFVGVVTPGRAALMDWLVREVDPRGFVYIPRPEPITETGSHQINGRQYEAILRRSRYHVWCSHHPFFYMEGERFRTSMLAGAVPVKVVGDRRAVPAGTPFGDLLVEQRDAAALMRDRDFLEVRRAFHDEFRTLPTLASELAAFLSEAGVVRTTAARGAALRAA